MSTEITPPEKQTLRAAEQVIERGLRTFIEVGEALAAIRDARLYRESHDTFEAYCKERWGMSRPRAYQLIESAQAASTIVDKSAITKESQARELAKVEPERRQEVVERATEATAGKLTAKAIAEAARPQPQLEVDIPNDAPTRSESACRADEMLALLKTIKRGDPAARATLRECRKHIDSKLGTEVQRDIGADDLTTYLSMAFADEVRRYKRAFKGNLFLAAIGVFYRSELMFATNFNPDCWSVVWSAMEEAQDTIEKALAAKESEASK